MSKLTWVQVINKHLKILVFVYFFYLKSFLDSKEYEINRNNPTSTEQLDLHMLKLILLAGIYLFYYTSILLFYIMRHLIGSIKSRARALKLHIFLSSSYFSPYPFPSNFHSRLKKNFEDKHTM